MLPASLARFVPEGPAPDGAGAAGRGRQRTLILVPGSWAELAGQLRERFPLLASRVLSASGGLAPGIVLVVNDEAMAAADVSGHTVRDGDEIALIAAIAGG
jgi:molybdopterin converting factor small subunit